MKKGRHEAILEIIAQQDIETQTALAQALLSRGYEVTQATVSRDIKEMRLVKAPGKDGRQHYVMTDSAGEEQNRYIRVLRDSCVRIDQAQNILVIRTGAGMAMAAAAALDQMEIPEIVGCIAGDDTIMAAVRTVEETGMLVEKIRRLIGDM